MRSSAAAARWPSRSRGPARRAAVGPTIRRTPSRTTLLSWDVVSGFAEPIPPVHPRTLWAQVPLVARRVGRERDLRVWTPDGEGPRLPPVPPRGPTGSSRCRALSHGARHGGGLEPLIGAGILAPHDLPLRIRPADPAALDGWRFA